MPRPRFLTLDPARRERLLEAAAREFATRGYEGASLNRIIERLRLSKGQFYYYFDDKADLFLAVLEWSWQYLAPIAEGDVERLEADSFWPAVERFVADLRERTRTMPWLIGLTRLIYTPPSEPAINKPVAQKLEAGRALQRAFVRRGQQVGCVRTDVPEDLLLGVLFAADSAFDRWFLERFDAMPPADQEFFLGFMLNLTRRILEPADGAERGRLVRASRPQQRRKGHAR